VNAGLTKFIFLFMTFSSAKSGGHSCPPLSELNSTNRKHLVLFRMQNRTFGPYTAAGVEVGQHGKASPFDDPPVQLPVGNSQPFQLSTCQSVGQCQPVQLIHLPGNARVVCAGSVAS
jgi:hypothetical protein